MSDQTEHKPFETQKEFMGHTITILPDWRLKVTGPEWEEDEKVGRETLFSSFIDAKNAIQLRVTDGNKIRAQNVKLDETVLDSRGARKHITRINRRTGTISDVDGNRVYPNVPWISEAIARRRQLNNDLKLIEEALKEVEIDVKRTYSSIDADNYPRVVAKLDEEIREKTVKAREMQQAKLEEKSREPSQTDVA